MNPSIRTFLIFNLLLSITLITSLAVIGNIFLEHRDLREHLDAQLSMVALTIQAFTTEALAADVINSIQRRINYVPSLIAQIETAEKSKILKVPQRLIQYQIWNRKNQMILRSRHAPTIPFSHRHTGFRDQWINNKPWRIFSIYDPSTQLNVVTAEPYDFRETIENYITKDSIFIMLLTYPFLGLLIWIIVGRGLESLKRITRAIRQRVPEYLEPVDIEEAPTEIRPLIIALNKLLVRLKEALGREKRFAADAAHELRTPLAALRMQTQVALKAKTEDTRKQALKKILSGVDRSSHVVEQLLTLTRMTPEQMAGKLEPMNLTELAQETIALLVPSAMEKETDIELIAQDNHVIILGIPTAIGILIRNLVDNAIRYSPKHSKVHVHINTTYRYAYLHVIDNGPGIPKELRKRVLERFFRVLGTKASGTGLGLGIVGQIAEIHNAKLSLHTPKSGKGLEAIVRLPLAKKLPTKPVDKSVDIL